MTVTSSEYIDAERRFYSLYVLQQRAIPHFADGLRSSSRRVLWTGKDGKKYKTATLAGSTMPIHPHSSPEGAINTLTAPYSNNIPLFTGHGAFGTLLKPNTYGAARYTSVAVSDFTKDVVFADIDIIPMVDNYDETCKEPKHFLPLIPLVLLNPSEGIAVGFASTILPRSLLDIASDQIKSLQGKKISAAVPQLERINAKAVDQIGPNKWVFKGTFERVNTTTIKVTNLPYGLTHTTFVDKTLPKLIDNEVIVGVDDGSVDMYDIDIKFGRGKLAGMSDDDIIKTLELKNEVSENPNMINFDGETVVSYSYEDAITLFTEWRLEWYLIRYQRLLSLLEVDIQKYKDILLAIKKNVGGSAKKVINRSELIMLLETIGIVHTDYIASLPVYRFTEEEKKKTEDKLNDALKTEKAYKKMIESKQARVDQYITELKDVLVKHKKGHYNQELE